MNGYKILKCFRKEKRVSGELPYPATGLIFYFLSVMTVRTILLACSDTHTYRQNDYFVFFPNLRWLVGKFVEFGHTIFKYRYNSLIF